jgi:hypothetical protein
MNGQNQQISHVVIFSLIPTMNSPTEEFLGSG